MTQLTQRAVLACSLVLSLTTGCLASLAAEGSAIKSSAAATTKLMLLELEQGKLRLTLQFVSPVSELSFIAPQTILVKPHSTDSGKTWTYELDIRKIGSLGVTAEGQAWSIFPLTLALPEQALAQLQTLSVQTSSGSQQRLGQYMLLGPGWKTQDLTDPLSKLYYINSEQLPDYQNLISKLIKTLPDWQLKMPQTLPMFIFYDHTSPEPVFSGVNERQLLTFLMPAKSTSKMLQTQGAPVLGHELLHLYTGKGLFDSPYALNSPDPILREGFLTYGGLVLAHEAGLMSQSEFEAYLQHIRSQANAVSPIPLRPVQKTANWTRLAYYRGALLAHQLTQELGSENSFRQLFKVLVEHPEPIQTEALAKLIQQHFHKDVSQTLERFLNQTQP